MKAPTSLTFTLVLTALAVSPTTAQEVAGQPAAEAALDWPQPFVTGEVASGVGSLYAQWLDRPQDGVGLCLKGRVLEEPGFGRVAWVEAVIRILSPDACRGAGMVGSVAFLPGGEYTGEQMKEMACAVLESRPDWYLYGYVSGSTLESDSHWCANAVPQPADATTASSGTI